MHNVPEWMLAAVVIGYAVIGWQWRRLAQRMKSTHGKFACWSLFAIFFLCASSGYLPRMIAPLWVVPDIIVLGSHVLLIVVIWTFIGSDQITHMTNDIEGNPDDF